MSSAGSALQEEGLFKHAAPASGLATEPQTTADASAELDQHSLAGATPIDAIATKAEPGIPRPAWLKPSAQRPKAKPREGGHRTQSSSIFKHKGASVRPCSIGTALAHRTNLSDDIVPVEQHAGCVDESATLDVGQAILAFEFIDRINDEVYHHYLPMIDATTSKDLGLQHQKARLAMPSCAKDLSRQQTGGSEGEGSNDRSRSHSTLYGEDHDFLPASASPWPLYDDGGSSGQGPGYQSTTPGYRSSTPGYQSMTPGYSSATPGHQSMTPGYQSTDIDLKPTWASPDRQLTATQTPSEEASLAEARESAMSRPMSRPQTLNAFDEDDDESWRFDARAEDKVHSALSVGTPACVDRPLHLVSESPAFTGSPSPVPDDELALDALGVPRATSVLESFSSSSATPIEQLLGGVSGERTTSRDGRLQDTYDEPGAGHNLASAGASFAAGDSRKTNFASVGSSLAASAESQMWPHASGLLPKCTVVNRSAKLKAVDSMPDSVAPSLWDATSTSSAAFQPGSTASSMLVTGTQNNAIGGGNLLTSSTMGRNTLLAGLPMILPGALPMGLASTGPTGYVVQEPDPVDPATASAPTKSCYAPGAARVRSCGQHRWERERLERTKKRAKARSQKHAQVAAQMHADNEALRNVGTMRCKSQQQSRRKQSWPEGAESILHAEVDAASGSLAAVSSADAKPVAQLPAVMSDASAEAGAESFSGGVADAQSAPAAPPGVGGAKASAGKATEDDQTWPSKRASVNGDHFEDLLTMHLQGDTASSRAKRKAKERPYPENAQCPFSYEDMDSTATVDLRCGHRFALARLNTARRGPAICASAGFAAKSALICPLCGDQDITTMPGASKMLTCYSTDTDAYLGELRKDWQRPLHLPMQSQSGQDFDSSAQAFGEAGKSHQSQEAVSLPAVSRSSEPASGRTRSRHL